MFKDVKGSDIKCKECSSPFITNSLRTRCYDPYMSLHLSIRNQPGLIMVIISSIMFLILIFTISVFVKYRDTPIVKHANRTMTILQLSSHLILSALPIYIITTSPSNRTCLITPIIIGIFFTITISINIAKTHKLYSIFSSSLGTININSNHNKNKKSGKKIGMGYNQRRFVSLIDWFIVGVLVLVDVSVLVISLSGKQISITSIYQTNNQGDGDNEKNLFKEITCNNTIDTITQLFYTISMVIANGIQAFRARGLPSYFRETTHVIYSSFSSVVILLATSVIYFVQESAFTRNAILISCLLVLNTINFSLVYLYKLYVILLRPQDNTVRAFNIKRKQKFDKQFMTANSTH